MFKNFEHRGMVFKEEVAALTAKMAEREALMGGTRG